MSGNWVVKAQAAQAAQPLYWIQHLETGEILGLTNQNIASLEPGAWKIIPKPATPGPVGIGGKGVENIVSD